MVTRECRVCKQEFPLEQLVRNPRCKHGRDKICVECHRAKMRKPGGKSREQYRKERLQSATLVCALCGKEKSLADMQKDKSTTLGVRARCKECTAKKTAKWKQENPERARESMARWYQENKEYADAKHKEWQEENRERVRAYSRKSYALRKGDTLTWQQWEKLCTACDNRCVCCGSDERLEPDHIVAVVNGGSHYISNRQPLCRSCNAKKRSKTIDYRPDAVKEMFPAT